MPLAVKIILGLATVWSSVYLASYALFRIKEKKHKSAISTLVLLFIMLAVLILSCA